MKYYFINNSLNNKIVGDYNHVSEAQHHCNIWEEPNFIKINFQPIVSNAILSRKARLTDLINAQTIGFSLRLLISDKLKDILEKYSKKKGRFFRSPVIYQNKKIDGYWIFHPYFFESSSIINCFCIYSNVMQIILLKLSPANTTTTPHYKKKKKHS